MRGQIAGLLHHWPGRLADVDAHFIGDDMGQRGLAQARRAEDQHMVQWFAAAAGGFDEYAHLLAHRFLADVVLQPSGRMARSTASSSLPSMGVTSLSIGRSD